MSNFANWAFKRYQQKRKKLVDHRFICGRCKAQYPAGCSIGIRLYNSTRSALQLHDLSMKHKDR